ncbi:MAG: Coq4 family protein [Candidatus Binatia bacterium]
MSDAPPARRRDWAHAWRALQDLIADPERTDRVFEIIRALSGNAFERAWQRFRAHPDGQRLLAERPSLLAALNDRAALRALPAGSLGRAYADFMDAARLDAAGLIEADEARRATTAPRRTGRATPIATTSASACATCTTSGTCSPATAATRPARPPTWPSPTPRCRTSASASSSSPAPSSARTIARSTGNAIWSAPGAAAAAPRR